MYICTYVQIIRSREALVSAYEWTHIYLLYEYVYHPYWRWYMSRKEEATTGGEILPEGSRERSWALYNMQKRPIQHAKRPRQHAKETCNLIDPTNRSHPHTTTRQPWGLSWALMRIYKYIYICKLQVIYIFIYPHMLIYMYVHTHARIGASFGSAIRSQTTKFSNSPAQVPSEMSSLSASRSKEPSRYTWYYIYVNIYIYIYVYVYILIYIYACYTHKSIRICTWVCQNKWAASLPRVPRSLAGKPDIIYMYIYI